MAQESEAVGVYRLGPDSRIQARHGLGVVVEDVRAGVDDGGHRLEVALEVRRQDLDRRIRAAAADGANRPREDARTSVLQIVAIHRGDDSVLQTELSD